MSRPCHSLTGAPKYCFPFPCSRLSPPKHLLRCFVALFCQPSPRLLSCSDALFNDNMISESSFFHSFAFSMPRCSHAVHLAHRAGMPGHVDISARPICHAIQSAPNPRNKCQALNVQPLACDAYSTLWALIWQRTQLCCFVPRASRNCMAIRRNCPSGFKGNANMQEMVFAFVLPCSYAQ